MQAQAPRLNRRLSGMDAAFLYLERKQIPLHIASVLVFDGPIPFTEFVAAIESKLDLIPRYRQVVAMPPFHLSLPTWEDDPHFDIRRHIFSTRLDPPGGDAELEVLAGRVLSQLLDRSKPLWDVHVVEGLSGGRGALIARVHHALADGVSGAGLLKVMLDASPQVARPARKARRKQQPPPAAPSFAEMIAQAVEGALGGLMAAEAGLFALARELTGERARNGLQNLAGLLPELAASVERLPFNRPCTGERKFCWTEFDLAEVQAVAAAAGGTINDAVLTVVTRALARYVKAHGQTVTNRLIRVVCPVSLREDRGETLGNQISFLPVVLPMDIRHPLEMMRAVNSRTRIMKDSRAAGMVALAAGWLNAAPPPLQEMFWRIIPEIVLPVPLFNLICTNVPSSPVPLYAAGRRLLSAYPQVPTGYELGIGIAVQSYAGKLCFGLIADSHAAPDVTLLRDFLNPAFQELRRAAGVKQTRRPRAARTGARAQRLIAEAVPSGPAPSVPAVAEPATQSTVAAEPVDGPLTMSAKAGAK